MDVAIVVLVSVLFGLTAWMVDALGRLGGGRNS